MIIGDKFKVQMKRVHEGFFNEPQSMKMLSVSIGVDRANICWYCREFKKNESIGVARKDYCTITKQLVNFYTTNPELFSKSNQISLFDFID